MHRAAFTLIELLVVISIIGLLAAMLLGGVRSVLASARSSQCANSQRQIVMAMLQYCEQNEGVMVSRLPANDYWYNALKKADLAPDPMTSPLYTCKANTKSGNFFRSYMRYAINAKLAPSTPIPIARISPTSRIAITDGMSWIDLVDDPVQAVNFNYIPALHDRGGTNAAFYDAHVERRASIPLDDASW